MELETVYAIIFPAFYTSTSFSQAVSTLIFPYFLWLKCRHSSFSSDNLHHTSSYHLLSDDNKVNNIKCEGDSPVWRPAILQKRNGVCIKANFKHSSVYVGEGCKNKRIPFHAMHPELGLVLYVYFMSIKQSEQETSGTTIIPQPFYGPFSGTTRVTGAKRELLDFMVQGKINRGRHTDHPAGRHSIRTNQCPPPPSTNFFLPAGCPSCRPTNSVKALKA